MSAYIEARQAFAATSSSDRYTEAREALAAFEHRIEIGYMPGEAEVRLADALQALIEPATIAETPEKAAMRVYMSIHSFPWLVHGDAMRDLITRGYLAGIQAAWESWEPDDYAPTLCAKCGADA